MNDKQLVYSATYETFSYLINGYEFEESFETGRSVWSAPNQGTQELLGQPDTDQTVKQILESLRAGDLIPDNHPLVAHEIHNVDVIRLDGRTYKRLGALIQEHDQYMKVKNRWLYYNKTLWGWVQITDGQEYQNLEDCLYELKHDLNNS